MYPKNYFNRGQQVIGHVAGPVIDNVSVRESSDLTHLKAKAIPANDNAKVWFHESAPSMETIKIEDSEGL